uniref:Uncharacterized protein n=1 Tax=Onchocerca volvulus TaxID=6282 RepID=A0A8R1TUN8_ONCVO
MATTKKALLWNDTEGIWTPLIPSQLTDNINDIQQNIKFLPESTFERCTTEVLESNDDSLLEAIAANNDVSENDYTCDDDVFYHNVRLKSMDVSNISCKESSFNDQELVPKNTTGVLKYDKFCRLKCACFAIG